MVNNTSQEPLKRGPKPKQLTEFTKEGLMLGRNRTPVPLDEVEKLASMGCNLKEISDFFGVHPDTMKRNCADTILKGQSQARLSLRRAMMRNATEHMVPSVQIFLAKAFLGMSENPLQSDDDKILPWQESFTEPQPEPTVKIGKTVSLQARVD